MTGFTDNNGYLKIALGSGGTISGDQEFTGNVTIDGDLTFGDASVDEFTINGHVRHTPVAGSDGDYDWQYSGAEDTGLTGSASHPDCFWNGARIVTWNTGALATQCQYQFLAETMKFAGASTVTNAATLYIDRAIQAGANATLTDSWSLWIDAGKVRFDDQLCWEVGTAVTAAKYSIGRDADATNQLHLNVPTGATIEFSVNDTAQVVISADTLDVKQNTITGVGSSIVGTIDTDLIIGVPNQGATSNNPGVGVIIQADSGGSLTTGGDGGHLTLRAGDAGGAGDNQGGNVYLDTGAKTGSGYDGAIVLSVNASEYGYIRKYIAAGAHPWIFNGEADGATSVVLTVGSSVAYVTAGAKLLSLRNDVFTTDVEKAAFYYDGTLQLNKLGSAVVGPGVTEYNSPDIKLQSSVWQTATGAEDTWLAKFRNDPTTGVTSVSDLKVYFQKNAVAESLSLTIHSSGNLTVNGTCYSTGVFGTDTTSATSATLKGTDADDASAVGTVLDNATALATPGGKLTSFRNATTEKAYVDINGFPMWGAGASKGGGEKVDIPYVRTTDATTTDIATVAVAEGDVFAIEVIVIGNQDAVANQAYYHMTGLFYRAAAGNVTQLGSTIYLAEVESNAAWDATLNADIGNQTIDVRVNGVIAININWKAVVRYTRLIQGA